MAAVWWNSMETTWKRHIYTRKTTLNVCFLARYFPMILYPSSLRPPITVKATVARHHSVYFQFRTGGEQKATFTLTLAESMLNAVLWGKCGHTLRVFWHISRVAHILMNIAMEATNVVQWRSCPLLPRIFKKRTLHQKSYVSSPGKESCANHITRFI